MDLVYLHGFASGPKGAKGTHCRAWAEARQIPFHAPDLNLPDFEHLTLTAQVEAVAELVGGLTTAARACSTKASRSARRTRAPSGG